MSAHTYWRLYFDGDNPNTYINISEMEMRATSGGADQCTGGTATADSQYSGQAPSLAFDDNNGTYWESNNGSTTRWIKYAFASPVDIVEYTIRNGPFAGEGPRTWYVQYSDDDTNWTNAAYQSGSPPWSAGETRTYYVDSGGATGKKYWRLNVSETVSTGDAYVVVAEMEMRLTSGGADQCTGGSVTASGYSPTGTPYPANAFDDNNSTIWESSGTGGPWWICYRFTAEKNIVEYTVRAGSYEFPRDWTLEHSGNGLDWTVADTQTGQTWSAGEVKTFTITSNISASIEETASAADTSDAGLTYAVSLSESGNVADTTGASVTLVAGVAESGTATDVVQSVADIVVSSAESVSAADVPTAVSSIYATSQDTANAADTTSNVVSTTADIAENGSIIDTSASVYVVAAQSEESADAVDAVGAAYSTGATCSESSSVADSATSASAWAVNSTETLNASDTVAAEIVINAAIYEVLIATATESGGFNAVASVAESTSAVDTFVVAAYRYSGKRHWTIPGQNRSVKWRKGERAKR